MEIQFTDTALNQLTKIAKSNIQEAKRIKEKIVKYSENPHGRYDIKHLKGGFGDLIRLRVGDYRVIFQIENNIMTIASIKHRQGAYND
jgi:addiction module RelE/StbE family toxin